VRGAARSVGLLLALVLSASLAGAGCGKYGPPQRVRPVQSALPGPGGTAGGTPAAGDLEPQPIEDPDAADLVEPSEQPFEERIEDPADQ